MYQKWSFSPYSQILEIRFSAIRNQILDFLSDSRSWRHPLPSPPIKFSISFQIFDIFKQDIAYAAKWAQDITCAHSIVYAMSFLGQYHFGQFWDILDSFRIENVGNYHFRHFLSQGNPKYPKIAQNGLFGHVTYILAT